MNKALPPLPLEASDLLSDAYCVGLPDDDFGRYMRMLCRQWVEGVIPASPSEVVKDAGLDSGSEFRVATIMEEKFVPKDGGLVNERLDVIREKRLALAEKRRENGRLGGRPVKKKARKPSGASPASKSKQAQLEQGFEEFWAAYPLKKSKGQARRTWAKLRLKDKAGEVMSGLQRCVASKDWRGREAKHLPYASTWLNAEGWLDQFDEAPIPQRRDAFEGLSPQIKDSLLWEVKESDKSVLHSPGNIDTERAMRRLARTRGLI